MSLEIERKYLDPDLRELHRQLHMVGATCCSRNFEENFVFDTSDHALRSQEILLRLRHAGTTTLTLKHNMAQEKKAIAGFKALEELETSVGSMKIMRRILEHLGYVAAFRYEKVRETWQWKSCTLCLDTLPFMDVVEIEGEPEAIILAARDLGLDGLKTSTLNYHQLYQIHRRSLGLPPEDGFVFPETVRTEIMATLSLSCKCG